MLEQLTYQLSTNEKKIAELELKNDSLSKNLNLANEDIITNKRKRKSLEAEITNISEEFKKRKTEFELIAEHDNSMIIDCKRIIGEKETSINIFKNKSIKVDTTLQELKNKFNQFKNEKKLEILNLKKTIEQQNEKNSKLTETLESHKTSFQNIERICQETRLNSNSVDNTQLIKQERF